MIETKDVKMIDCEVWDDLVIKTYGHLYNIQQQDGCQPRGVYYLTVPDDDAFDYQCTELPYEINGENMGVSFEAWKKADKEEILENLRENGHDICHDLFWKRNFYPSVEVVANDLHERGLLPAGNYAIDIDW